MKRFIAYGLAFIITVAVKGTFISLLIGLATDLRGNRISLNAHEHNAAAREALTALHIPDLKIIESHSSPPGFPLAFLVTIWEAAGILAIFFFALWFVRLVMRQDERSNVDGTDSDQPCA